MPKGLVIPLGFFIIKYVCFCDFVVTYISVVTYINVSETTIDFLDNITFSEQKDIEADQLRQLYLANDWSSGRQPTALHRALENSHTVISAWDEGLLVGVGNALSDGFLVVYYPHLLVHPDYQGQGIGKQIMDRLLQRYEGLHMQMLVAEADAMPFYEKCGFTRASDTQSMWIYKGNDH